MSYQPQHITAPDGTRLVVITAADYERLLDLSEDRRDAADAARISESVKTEGTIPAEVLNAMLDRGLSPVQAWREYRGLTQAALAEKAGLTQPYIVKIESGKAYGRPASRKAIAAALDAPLWALEDND